MAYRQGIDGEYFISYINKPHQMRYKNCTHGYHIIHLSFIIDFLLVTLFKGNAQVLAERKTGHLSIALMIHYE